MTDWGWVMLGFGVTYGSMAVYIATLRARTSRARRQLEELR
ncbi:hypothetical protein [Actinotalea ferrariae]|nr:hypothetical protein [Actinotalea ferrariae]